MCYAVRHNDRSSKKVRILGRRRKEEKERRKRRKEEGRKRRKIAASCGRKCDSVKVVSKGRVVRTLHCV